MDLSGADEGREAEPIRDYGFRENTTIDPLEFDRHHMEMYQPQRTMYVGIHYPEKPGGKKRRHHHKHRHRDRDKKPVPAKSSTGEPIKPPTPPSERVQFLLGQENDDEHQVHDIFCEMDELRCIGDEGDMEWKETARWVKFEEDVEEGGERWSKPHVATLSLHSLFELRKGITSGTVMLDMNANNIYEVADLVLDNMVGSRQLLEEHREKVRDTLLSRHRHQHDKDHSHHHGEKKGLPLIRSLAEIGRKHSNKNLEKGHGSLTTSRSHTGALLDLPKQHAAHGSHLWDKIRKSTVRDLGGIRENASQTSLKDLEKKDSKKHIKKKKVPTATLR